MSVATVCNAALAVSENGVRFTMKTWICSAHVVMIGAVPSLEYRWRFSFSKS